jgi:hypothetical protein
MKDVFALHRIVDANEFSFDPAAYSRFKFGDGTAADAFGTALANGFITTHGTALLQSEQLVILPSPYTAIPTASYYLTLAFTKVLNRFLCMNGRNPAETSKIHRFKTYSIDYGALDMQSRQALIINDKYHLDHEYLRHKTLIFTDDIRITGSHELIIRNLLQGYGLNNESWFLYYAQLHNMDIHPSIENKLNYYTVNSLQSLAEVLKCPDLRMNTRLVKYILHAPGPEFEALLLQLPLNFLLELGDCSIGNNYHQMKEYRQNASYLFNYLQKTVPSWQMVLKPELQLI